MKEKCYRVFMARRVRIGYTVAWYHIMHQGRRSEDIFYERGDYEEFVELLKESSE